MQSIQSSQLCLDLTVRSNITVLPRCLQILSRRGYQLISLDTKETAEYTVLRLVVRGDTRWHAAVPQLLEKAVDVMAVTVRQPYE